MLWVNLCKGFTGAETHEQVYFDLLLQNPPVLVTNQPSGCVSASVFLQKQEDYIWTKFLEDVSKESEQ